MKKEWDGKERRKEKKKNKKRKEKHSPTDIPGLSWVSPVFHVNKKNFLEESISPFSTFCIM